MFDDVAEYGDIKPSLPPDEGRFHQLLTSRHQFGRGIRSIPLDVLNEEPALELLKRAMGSERVTGELDEAKALCQWLGYLPLGIELVGRYLDAHPDRSLAKMQKRLESKRLEAKALSETDEEMTAQLGVAAAFQVSWEDLSAQARQLGGMLSLFATAPIPWDAVEACYPDIDPDDLEDLRDESLLALHLLQRTATGTYQLHPLIREFFRSKLDEVDGDDECKRQFARVMVTVAQEIPQTPIQTEIRAPLNEQQPSLKTVIRSADPQQR